MMSIITAMRNMALDKDMLQNIETLNALNDKSDILDLGELTSDDILDCVNEGNNKNDIADAIDVTTLCEPLLEASRAAGDGCVESHVFSDIEMFEAYSRGGADTDDVAYSRIKLTGGGSSATTMTVETVAHCLSRHARLRGGRQTLQDILRHPTSNMSALKKRQGVIRALNRDLRSDGLVEKIQQILARMAPLENDMRWAFQVPSEEAQALYDMVYFRSWFLRGLNKSPTCLTAFCIQRIILSPVIGIMMPLMAFLVPYFVLQRMGMPLPFRQYLHILYRALRMMFSIMLQNQSWTNYIWFLFTFIFYFQNFLGTIEIARTLNSVCKIICKKIRNVHMFLRDSMEMCRLLEEANIDVREFWSNQDPLNLQMMQPPLEEDTPASLAEYSLLSNFGTSLAAFHNFDTVKNGNIVRWAYMIDALVAVEGCRQNLSFCYVDFASQRSSPNLAKLHATDIWHPCLDAKTAVRNNVVLGDHNMILTGPNAGGKSTLLKSILVAVVLGQTICIAPCSSMSITPFALVRSQINVPDVKGSQSLFEAEMFRCKDSLERMRSTHDSGGCALVVMDEIFSSTNVIEGISGAYAVAKAMAAYKSAVTIISTHFSYLCKLQKDTSKRFKNYQMQVSIMTQPDKSVVVQYPYQLRRGISRQYIALELLRNNGFEKDILVEATRVRDSLTNPGIKT